MSNGWTVRIPADRLKPGDRFIFAEEIGGEDEVLTVESTQDHYGTLVIGTEEEDFDIEVLSTQMVTVVDEEET